MDHVEPRVSSKRVTIFKSCIFISGSYQSVAEQSFEMHKDHVTPEKR